MYIYEKKIYTYAVEKKNKVSEYYDEIRKEIQFPKGNKIYKNGYEIDLNKTFKENYIINNMRLEIGK